MQAGLSPGTKCRTQQSNFSFASSLQQQQAVLEDRILCQGILMMMKILCLVMKWKPVEPIANRSKAAVGPESCSGVQWKCYCICIKWELQKSQTLIKKRNAPTQQLPWPIMSSVQFNAVKDGAFASLVRADFVNRNAKPYSTVALPDFQHCMNAYLDWKSQYRESCLFTFAFPGFQF